MQNLLNFSPDQLTKLMIDENQQKFRAAQIWQWIYIKGVRDFASMSNLNKDFRELLGTKFSLDRPAVTQELVSIDGTTKWLLKFPDNNEIETVFIPEERRGTLCISSQVGCTLTCTFCHTGTQKLVRNLTAGEIIAQILHAKDSFSDWPSDRENRIVTNVVLMGMGEPLLNYDNVVQAVKAMLHPDGLNISRQKITLSTSGIVPDMLKYAKEVGTNMAVSLHAVHNELRDKIVPINRKYPLEELISACREYVDNTAGRRITFEYVMLKGVNDSREDAKTLIRIIAGMPAKINLIPFNPWPGAPYECSAPETIREFASIVENAGYMSPIRSPRGQDIMAACGQLKSSSIRELSKKI